MMKDNRMHPTIDAFETCILERRTDALPDLLAEEVTFRPPTYWAEWQGRAVVAALLGHVGAIFEDFRYLHKWDDHPHYALWFRTRVGTLDATGVDVLRLDGEGRILDFEVMMRPHKTVGVLREKMMERVMADPFFQDYLSKG